MSAESATRAGRAAQMRRQMGAAGTSAAAAGDGTPWHTDVRSAEARDRRILATLATGASAVPADLAEQYGNLDIGGFDITQMRFDMTVLASSDEAARLLAPVRVMHDNVWTWLDFGDKKHIRAGAINEVTDGTEAAIDWHYAGPGPAFPRREGRRLLHHPQRTAPAVHHPRAARRPAAVERVARVGREHRRLPHRGETRARPRQPGRARRAVPPRSRPLTCGSRRRPTRRGSARSASLIEVAPHRSAQAPHIEGLPESLARTICARLAREGVGCTVIRPLEAPPAGMPPS